MQQCKYFWSIKSENEVSIPMSILEENINKFLIEHDYKVTAISHSIRTFDADFVIAEALLIYEDSQATERNLI